MSGSKACNWAEMLGTFVAGVVRLLKHPIVENGILQAQPLSRD